MIKVAYSDIKRISDLARAFSIDPETARRAKVLAASCTEMSDKELLAKIGLEFDNTPRNRFRIA